MLTSRYLPHRGGLEMVTSHLAAELANQGHQVVVGTSRYPRSLPKNENIDDIEIQRFTFIEPEWVSVIKYRFDLFSAGLWYKSATTRELKRWMMDFNPEVVNLHYLGAPTGFLYRVWKRRPFPLVVSLHGGDVTGEPFQSHAKLKRFLQVTDAANAVTACSRALATEAEKLNPALTGRVKIIHNAVNSERFAAAIPSELGFPYILGVGQLSKHKGFDLLIRGFASIADKYPTVNLVIAGDGDQRVNLEAITEQENLSERVIFKGKVDEANVASLMKGCQFLAFPSLREPFGIVALEGMAAGKIVLASQVGGIPEFLPVPPNIFVEPDVTCWGNALNRALFLSSTGKLNGSSNLAVAAQFSWQKLTGSYLQVYTDAINDFNKQS